MAVSGSGQFALTQRDIWRNDTAVDYEADVLKVALFSNAITPNFSTDTRYGAAPYNASEVGTPAGGVTLTTKTVTVDTGNVVMFDADNSAWASQTFSGARCGLIYDDTIATPIAKPALVLIDFGIDYSVTSGVFTITWHATGIARADWA